MNEHEKAGKSHCHSFWLSESLEKRKSNDDDDQHDCGCGENEGKLSRLVSQVNFLLFFASSCECASRRRFGV